MPLFLGRRELLTRSLPFFVAPLLGTASISQRYSTRTVDLVAESNVIDMLGLLTLNSSVLEQWHQAPGAFADADFRKLRSSGIDVFHPAVAFEVGQPYDVTRAWFEKWNRLIRWHPDYFLRVGGADDLARAVGASEVHSFPDGQGGFTAMSSDITCLSLTVRDSLRSRLSSHRSPADLSLTCTCQQWAKRDRVKGARSVCTSEDLTGIQGLFAHVDPCFRSSPTAQVRVVRICSNPSAQCVAATSGPIV